MVTSSCTNFLILFCQGSQVLQEPFIKANVIKSSFHLLTPDHWVKAVYILSRQKSVATNLTKVVLFEVCLFDIW